MLNENVTNNIPMNACLTCLSRRKIEKSNLCGHHQLANKFNGYFVTFLEYVIKFCC